MPNTIPVASWLTQKDDSTSGAAATSATAATGPGQPMPASDSVPAPVCPCVTIAWSSVPPTPPPSSTAPRRMTL